MSGSTGHGRGIPLRRPATTTVRSVGSDDTEQNRNMDAVADAIGGITQVHYTESKLLDGRDSNGNETPGKVVFTASTLDQTLPHKLSGRCEWYWSAETVSTVFPVLVRQPPSNAKLESTHIRLISNAEGEFRIVVAR